MRIIKNKFILSSFFIVLMLVGIVSSGTNNASGFTVPEDPYEENDDFWDARFIGQGYYSNLCQGDDDWYNISIGANEIIQISLYFDGSQNDIDFELYDNSYSLIGGSYGVSNSESFSWTSFISQFLSIRVYGWNNNESYDMDILITENNDDWAEPNDYIYDATNLGLGYHDGFISYDDDWYEVWLESEDELEIKLNFDYGNTLMELELYNEYENFLTSGYYEDGKLTLSWTNYDYSKYVYIKIWANNSGSWYDIDLRLIGDDYLEENDDWGFPRSLAPSKYNELFNYDDDFYIFHLKEGETGTIYLNCNNNVQLWLEEISTDDGSISYSFYPTDGNLVWQYHVDIDRDILFAVKGDNQGNWYDLELKIDTKEDNSGGGDDPFADIPGFPIEIIGIVFLMSSLTVILSVNKKKH